MQPADLLEPRSVSVANNAGSKKRVLEEAAALLAATISDAEQEPIYERLLERERLGSTGVGHGVALPHARIDGLTRAYGAFVQLAQGVDYDAIDGQPVDLVFALVVPQEATAEHLQLLAQLAALFSDDVLCSRLRKGSSTKELLTVIGTPPADRQTA
jgi:PTS system nitrogen regulatory IIA component